MHKLDIIEEHINLPSVVQEEHKQAVMCTVLKLLTWGMRISLQ